MKLRNFLFSFVFSLALFQMVRADDLPSAEVKDIQWTIIPQKDAKTKPYSDSKFGKGSMTYTDITFETQVTATRGQPVENVQVFVYAIQRNLQWIPNDANKVHSVRDAVTTDVFSLTAENHEAKLVTTAVHFEGGHSQTGDVSWKLGTEYCGYLAELRIDGHLEGVKMAGVDASQIKKAFLVYRESKDYNKPTPKEGEIKTDAAPKINGP